jgi:hypothetical protein
MTKAELLDYMKSMMDTNVRIANDPTYDAGHKALASERFSLLLSVLPAIQNLDEPAKEENSGEGIPK